MIRRLIVQKRRRGLAAVKYTPSTIVSRYSSAEGISRVRLDGIDSTSPHLIPPSISTSGFEIQGISTRILSSEAVIAPLELFKAISTLNNSSKSTATLFSTTATTSDNLNIISDTTWHGLGLNTNDEVAKEVETSESREQEIEDENLVDDVTIVTSASSSESEFVSEERDTKDIAISATEKIDEPINQLPNEELNEFDTLKQKMERTLDQEFLQNTARGHVKISKLFNEVYSSPYAEELLNEKELLSMFFYLIRNNNVTASYEVLKYHAEQCKKQGRLVRLDMYQRIIHRLRPIDKFKSNNRTNNTPPQQNISVYNLQRLVNDLTRHIKEEYGEGKKKVYQYILLPELVAALIDRKNEDIAAWANPIMKYILHNNFPVLYPELYEYILSRGKRKDPSRLIPSSQDIFPYERVLSLLTSSGHKPQPEALINVLQCYHPFNDLEATKGVLSVIQQLHLDTIAKPESSSRGYHIDLGTLESISMASARRDVDLSLMVWDLAEHFGYSPTVTMFEDVIMSFAATKQDKNLFSALVDMEKNGHMPSAILMRYIALKVSYTQQRMDHSQNMLNWRGNEHLRSTSAMNVMLIGYGMMRDLNNAFFVFEELPRLGLQPDINTFSFLMEALYIDGKDRFPYKPGQPLNYNTQDVDDVVGAAQIILDAMEEAGIQKTKQFFYEHIRLLYTLGLLEDSKLVLEEAISAGIYLPMASVFMLSTRLAESGDFDNARAVAATSKTLGCGDFQDLTNRISNMETDYKID